MLSIQCDDNTAASIIVDDITEISMSQDDWEISGRPTMGDTITFVVSGGGAFAEAVAGMAYLVTDECLRDGRHVISFAAAPMDDVSADNVWDIEPEDYDDPDFDEMPDGSEDMGLLAEFPGIIAPNGGEGAKAQDGGAATRRAAIKNMPSMRLMGSLMQEHGMSMREIVAGLVALENEAGDGQDKANDDVIVDFFSNHTDDIREISRNFEAYATSESKASRSDEADRPEPKAMSSED